MTKLKIEITVLDGKYREDNEGSAFKRNLKDWLGFHQIFYFEGLGAINQRKMH